MTTGQPTGSHPADLPTPPTGFPAPVPARSTSRGTVLIAAIVGLALGAAVVGGAWLLFGNDGGSSSPVSAPARLADYVQYDEAEVFDGSGPGQEIADRIREWDSRSSKRLSEAFAGAGAVVRTYTDERAETRFMLEIVRAPVPDPYVPFSDPEELGLERPVEEVRVFGQVACVLSNTGPDLSIVVACQRGDDELTVRITHVGGEGLQEDPAAVAELVDAAWRELS